MSNRRLVSDLSTLGMLLKYNCTLYLAMLDLFGISLEEEAKNPELNDTQKQVLDYFIDLLKINQQEYNKLYNESSESAW